MLSTNASIRTVCRFYYVFCWFFPTSNYYLENLLEAKDLCLSGDDKNMIVCE